MKKGEKTLLIIHNYVQSDQLVSLSTSPNDSGAS
uniref:Uncharacterized protein n=1 Tax=Anguilla anguilla TaxID=7936 RepID=A0A0E9VTR8_ANGAN